MEVIHECEKRRLEVDGSELTIRGLQSGRTLTVNLSSAEIDDEVPAEVAKVVRSRGEDPAGWYTLRVRRSRAKVGGVMRDLGGGVLAALPGETREAVVRAIVRTPARVARENAAREAALEAAVPGLSALRAARDEAEDYQDRFARMMEDEDNDGARTPKAPATDAAALARQYPRAALYLRAEAYQQAANHHKSAAGTEAVKLLESDGSEEEARKVLENWLPAERVWD